MFFFKFTKSSNGVEITESISLICHVKANYLCFFLKGPTPFHTLIRLFKIYAVYGLFQKLQKVNLVKKEVLNDNYI